MVEEKNQTAHIWKVTDVAGYFICRCGSIGNWNNDLKKVEVTEPVPYEVYAKRHNLEEEK